MVVLIAVCDCLLGGDVGSLCLVALLCLERATIAVVGVLVLLVKLQLVILGPVGVHFFAVYLPVADLIEIFEI